MLSKIAKSQLMSYNLQAPQAVKLHIPDSNLSLSVPELESTVL